MAPRALSGVGGLVANEMIKKVVDNSFKKYPGRGRKLGNSRRTEKNVEEGLRRVLEFGIEHVEQAGGVQNLFKKGAAKAKREGFMKVAKEVISFATAGLVKMVNPQGFAAVFKPSGRLQLVYASDPLQGCKEPTLTMEELITREANLPRVVVTMEEPGATGAGQYGDEAPTKQAVRPRVKSESRRKVSKMEC